jgi:hypothetical protein
LNELALGLVMSNSLKEYSFFTAVDGAVILVDAVDAALRAPAEGFVFAIVLVIK